MNDQVHVYRRRRRTLAVLCLSLATPISAWQPLPTRQTNIPRYRSLKRQNALSMSAPHAHIDVALDKPLFVSDLFTKAAKPSRAFQPAVWIKSWLSSISSKSLRVAIVTFAIAFVLSMTVKYSDSLFGGVGRVFKLAIGRVQRVLESLRSKEVGVPMPFDDEAKDGWGVCTVKSKRKLGKTSFVEYVFELPEPDYVLGLDLGQQISMCCLDNDSNVAKGDFFSYNQAAVPKPGQFSILVPNRSHDANMKEIGVDAANFIRVIKQDLKVGDEVAVKPGPNKLSYRGQYLPVTDMVYFACGNGIVPVLDQVRAVLPSGSSSVKSVTVVWINEETKDFDVTAELLEKEYFKYSTKLAVSCIVTNPRKKQIADNVEINAAVPDFRQGTMAVLAGPQDVMKRALIYLEDRGYPRDTICVL